MYHELLMALNGFSGTIFFDSDSGGMKVSSCVPNLHPAEKNILERLCSISTKYRILLDFVKKYKYSTDPQAKKKGLYLKSFCCGLETIFDLYQQNLVEIEEELLKDQFLPLTHFLKLEKFNPLFDVLLTVTKEIEDDEKIHGCRILDVLYKHSISGVPFVENGLNKVLHCCQAVMYKQVFCWIMNGYIEDPFKEFFIQFNPPVEPESPTSNTSFDKEKVAKDGYQIYAKLLPSHVPSYLAEKIWSIGKYISILGAAENSDSYILFLKNEKLFTKKIEKLMEKPAFSLTNFEVTIDDIRKCAAEHLWDVIVNKANVMSHFKRLKDFYLLGKGELFVCYIAEAHHLLSVPTTLSSETEASKLFHNIARRIYPDDEYITEKFSISFEQQKKKSDEIDKESLSKLQFEPGWFTIVLNYEVPHPLNILITPHVIEKYNTVFRFLLSVRRIQIELHQCWALQMRKTDNYQKREMLPFWTLRSHMSFLIDNFQYYVLVDVLESCFNNLINKMESVKDYEAIQQIHSNFVSNIISQCFLELHAVHQSLNEILELCSQFCKLMNRINVNYSQKEMAQFENIKLNFQRHSSLLFRILSGVRSHQVSPHLAQLLLRIDYNKYLSTSGGQLGGTK